MLDFKVAHANCLHPAVMVKLFKRLVGIHVLIKLRCRPMNQVQINIIQLQLLQTFLKGAQRIVIPLVGVPNLRCNKKLLPGNAGLLDRFPHSAFITVNHSCINRRITCLKSVAHRLGCLFVANLPDAKTKLRHLQTVI
ncbi:hypothetical protein D3C80_1666440 [compost metagenome]